MSKLVIPVKFEEPGRVKFVAQVFGHIPATHERSEIAVIHALLNAGYLTIDSEDMNNIKYVFDIPVSK